MATSYGNGIRFNK